MVNVNSPKAILVIQKGGYWEMVAAEVVCLDCNEILEHVGTFRAEDLADEETVSEARLLMCPKCRRSVAMRCTKRRPREEVMAPMYEVVSEAWHPDQEWRDKE